MVQVHHDEGVANRIDPESCAAAREGISEALTGERIGQPLSRSRRCQPGQWERPSSLNGMQSSKNQSSHLLTKTRGRCTTLTRLLLVWSVISCPMLRSC